MEVWLWEKMRRFGYMYTLMKMTTKPCINYIITLAVDFLPFIANVYDGVHTPLSAFVVKLLREDEFVSFWIGEPPPGR